MPWHNTSSPTVYTYLALHLAAPFFARPDRRPENRPDLREEEPGGGCPEFIAAIRSLIDGMASSPRQRWGKVLVAEEEVPAKKVLSSIREPTRIAKPSRAPVALRCQRVDDCTS